MAKKLPNNPKKKNKRWLAKRRPSLFQREKKKPVKAKKDNAWRTKKYSFRFGRSRTLIITRRKFRAKRSKQPKKYKTFVLPVNNAPFPVKEIAFQLVTKRVKKSKAKRGSSKKRGVRYAVPIFLITIGLFGIIFFGLKALDANKIADPETFAPPALEVSEPAVPVESGPKTLVRSEPSRVKIARLGIDYSTIQVGKKADGTMEVPPVLQKVTAWYKYSPTPGELGPSIIVGHVDSYKGPSVFWRLREVVAGDIIDITRADGSVAQFKVDSLQQFEQAAFPTEQVYGNIDHAGLRLITCGGTFNHKTQHYDKNTVVFATLVTDS